MSNVKRPKQVTRIVVQRDREDNDVAVTYYVTKFGTSYDAIDFFGAERAKILLQNIHERDERRHAIRNADVITKAVNAIAEG